MWTLVVLSLLFNAGCAKAADMLGDGESPEAKTYSTPTKLLPAVDYPTFHDDKSLRGMRLAISRQLARFDAKDMTAKIKLGAKTYPVTRLRTTLKTFDALISEFDRCVAREAEANCFRDLNAEIRRQFDVYIPSLVAGDPRYGEPDWAFFTAYHTMPIEGKLSKDGEYAHAVYRNPGNSNLYFSRVEIDFMGKLAGRGLELLYTKSLFDLYLLHVQGSGKATILNPDGTKSGFYLNYDGTNNKKWTWISKYMMEKGYITNPSIPAQRKFLRAHPELQKEIYSTCPSYVFSKITRDPPMGSDSAPVTDGRSIAQDSTLYAFKGLLAYVEATRPVETGNYDLEEEDPSKVPFQSFQRFFLDQDTGGAIKGKGRADLYFGEDVYAQFSATNMQQTGRIYYLIAK